MQSGAVCCKLTVYDSTTLRRRWINAPSMQPVTCSDSAKSTLSRFELFLKRRQITSGCASSWVKNQESFLSSGEEGLQSTFVNGKSLKQLFLAQGTASELLVFGCLTKFQSSCDTRWKLDTMSFVPPIRPRCWGKEGASWKNCGAWVSSEEVVGVRVMVIPKLRICRQLEKPKVIWGELDLGSKLCGSCSKQHSKLEDEFCEDKVFLSRWKKHHRSVFVLCFEF